MIDDEENSANELRYKCRRHNADYNTDSAIPDNEHFLEPIRGILQRRTEQLFNKIKLYKV